MEDALKRENELEMSLGNRKLGTIVFETTICVAIAAFAFLGNALLCFSLYKTPGFRAPQNYYIANLAAADMLFAVLCMPFFLGALIKGKWIFGETFCQIEGSLVFILVNASLSTMTLIAVNRFFKMSQSVNNYPKIYSGRNILLSILLAWTVSISVVLAVFSFENRPFRFHPGKFLCFLDMENQGVRFYTLGAYVAVCAVVFPVMILCYFKVYRKVKAHFDEIANSGHQASRSFLNEAKITKMLFVTLVAFLVCWTPAIITDIFDAFHGQYSLPRQVYFWQIVLYASSSAINPIIYGFMRRELRMAYKEVLTCKRR